MGNLEVRQTPQHPLSVLATGVLQAKTEGLKREIELDQEREYASFQNELLTERATTMAGVQEEINTRQSIRQFALNSRLAKEQFKQEAAEQERMVVLGTDLASFRHDARAILDAWRAGAISTAQLPEALRGAINRSPLRDTPEYEPIMQRMLGEITSNPQSAERHIRFGGSLGMRHGTAKQKAPTLADTLNEKIALIRASNLPPDVQAVLEEEALRKAVTGTTGTAVNDPRANYNDAQDRLERLIRAQATAIMPSAAAALEPAIQRAKSEVEHFGRAYEAAGGDVFDPNAAAADEPPSPNSAADYNATVRYGEDIYAGPQQETTAAPARRMLTVTRAASALPHPDLKPYWADLSEEDRQDILAALQANPKNLDIILGRLRSGQ